MKTSKNLIGQNIIAYGQKAKVTHIERRKFFKAQRNFINVIFLENEINTPDTFYKRDFVFTMEIEAVLINNEQFN